MEDYQKRVVEEKVDLDNKFRNLGDFISSSKFENLPGEDKSLLSDQFVAMSQYSDVLSKRIARF